MPACGQHRRPEFNAAATVGDRSRLDQSLCFGDLIHPDGRADAKRPLAELFGHQRDSFQIDSQTTGANIRQVRWTAWRRARRERCSRLGPDPGTRVSGAPAAAPRCSPQFRPVPKVFVPRRTGKQEYQKHRKRGMNAMTSAALSPVSVTPQIEAANFLNLMIVDDERSIREACREVAQSLGFKPLWPIPPSTPTAYWMPRPSTPCCSTCACRAPAASMPCGKSRSAAPTPWSSWSPATAPCSRQCRP